MLGERREDGWQWVPWGPRRRIGRGRYQCHGVAGRRVDEALEEVGVGGLGAHLDSAAHAVKGHRDDGVAGLPADGAVFGIVGDRPNAGGGS